MRLIQEQIWQELKDTLDAYVQALAESQDIDLINDLIKKIKELEDRLSSMKSTIAGKFFTYSARPHAIVRMHLGESPEFV